MGMHCEDSILARSLLFGRGKRGSGGGISRCGDSPGDCARSSISRPFRRSRGTTPLLPLFQRPLLHPFHHCLIIPRPLPFPGDHTLPGPRAERSLKLLALWLFTSDMPPPPRLLCHGSLSSLPTYPHGHQGLQSRGHPALIPLPSTARSDRVSRLSLRHRFACAPLASPCARVCPEDPSSPSMGCGPQHSRALACISRPSSHLVAFTGPWPIRYNLTRRRRPNLTCPPASTLTRSPAGATARTCSLPVERERQLQGRRPCTNRVS